MWKVVNNICQYFPLFPGKCHWHGKYAYLPAFWQPWLFLYYINDLPERLRSRVCLFADDTIAYLVIILPKDTEALQEDLEDLATWENKWHIEFHANKCVVLTVSGKKAPVHADYKLHDQTLTRVQSAKYLGVTLTDDLKWDQHMNNICDKANRTIGFLR